MSLPRLHPDDLQELITGVLEGLTPELKKLLSKDALVSSMTTFTISDAAKILDKSEQSITNYCSKGVIKAFRCGKEWRITQQSLIDHQNGKKS
jgi:hypothetical protein